MFTLAIQTAYVKEYEAIPENLNFILYSKPTHAMTLISLERQKAPETIEVSGVYFYGGSGWIRTTEVVDNRFTVCPLWPLGNAPIFSFAVFLVESGAGGRT